MVDLRLPDLPDDILRLVVKYILCDDTTLSIFNRPPVLLPSSKVANTIIALRRTCRGWMHIIDSMVFWQLLFDLSLDLHPIPTTHEQVRASVDNRDQNLAAVTYRVHLATDSAGTAPIMELDSIAPGWTISNGTVAPAPGAVLPTTVLRQKPSYFPYIHTHIGDHQLAIPCDRIRALKLVANNVCDLANTDFDHASALSALLERIVEWLPNIVVFHQLGVGPSARPWMHAMSSMTWGSTLTTLHVNISHDWNDVVHSVELPALLDLRVNSGSAFRPPAIRTLPIAPRLQKLLFMAQRIDPRLFVDCLPRFARTLRKFTAARGRLLTGASVVASQTAQEWPKLRQFHGSLDMFEDLIASSASSATAITSLPALQSFWLQSAEYRVYQPVPLFPPMPRLVTASFYCMAMSPTALAGLNTAAPGLRTLSIFEGQFTSSSSDLMPSRITFASLTKLSVTGMENAMGASDFIDAPHLANVTWDATGSPVLPIPWHTVTSVSIESHEFGKDDVRITGAHLSALPHLKSLYLPGRDLEWIDAAPTLATVTHLRASPAKLAAFPAHALPNLVHLESMGSKDPPFRALPAAAALSLRRITGNLHPTLIEQLARMPQLKSIDGRHRVDVDGDAMLPEWTLEYSQGHVVWASVPRMELTGRIAVRLVVRVVSVQDAAKAVSDVERMVKWVVMGGKSEERVEPLSVEVYLANGVDLVIGSHIFAMLAGVGENDLDGRSLEVFAALESSGSDQIRLCLA